MAKLSVCMGGRIFHIVHINSKGCYHLTSQTISMYITDTKLNHPACFTVLLLNSFVFKNESFFYWKITTDDIFWASQLQWCLMSAYRSIIFSPIMSHNALFVAHNCLYFNMQSFTEMKTEHRRRIDISILQNRPYKRNLEIAHCEFIMELIAFFSVLCNSIEQEVQLHQNYLHDTSSQNLFFLLFFAWGVLSFHSRSSKTCLISIIQVPVKVKP